MTDIEIEKLADALTRKLQVGLSMEIQDVLEEQLTDRLNFVVRRILTKIGSALHSTVDDI